MFVYIYILIYIKATSARHVASPRNMAMDSVDLTLDDGWLDPLQARSTRHHQTPWGVHRAKANHENITML